MYIYLQVNKRIIKLIKIEKGYIFTIIVVACAIKNIVSFSCVSIHLFIFSLDIS